MLNTYSHVGHQPRRARRIPARPCPCPPGPCAHSLAGSPHLLACRVLTPAHLQVRVPSRLQGPHACALAGSPRLRACRVPTPTRMQGHHACAHAHTLAGPTSPHLQGHHACTPPRLRGPHARTHARSWGPHACTPHPRARTRRIPCMHLCICWMCASAMHLWRRVNLCSSTSTLL